MQLLLQILKGLGFLWLFIAIQQPLGFRYFNYAQQSTYADASPDCNGTTPKIAANNIKNTAIKTTNGVVQCKAGLQMLNYQLIANAPNKIKNK